MDELLAMLKKLLGEGKKASDIVKAVLDDPTTQPVYQEIFQRGHAEETRQTKPKLDAFATQITTLTTERDAAQTALTDLQSKTPDVKTVTEQFQREISALKEQHKADKKQWEGKMNDSTLNRARSDLKASLIAKGVDPDYADVLVNKDENKTRIRPTDDGAVQVMALGQEIPLTAGEGQTPLGLFTDELATKVPAKFLTSNADRGSDTRNGGGGGPQGSEQFAAIRKSVAERNKAPASQGISAIADRMGTSIAK